MELGTPTTSRLRRTRIRRSSQNPINANFLELRQREVRRNFLLGTWVNKGLSSLVWRLAPEPGGPSRNGYGPPYGYELAYSVPCANPYHHLPEEAPRLHTPVHVALHVPP